MKKALIIILIAATACSHKKQQYQIFADMVKKQCEREESNIDKIKTVYISVDSFTAYRRMRMQIEDSIKLLLPYLTGTRKSLQETLISDKLDSITILREKNNTDISFYRVAAVVLITQKDGTEGIITHHFNYFKPYSLQLPMGMPDYLAFVYPTEEFRHDLEIKSIPITEYGKEHLKQKIDKPDFIKYSY